MLPRPQRPDALVKSSHLRECRRNQVLALHLVKGSHLLDPGLERFQLLEVLLRNALL